MDTTGEEAIKERYARGGDLGRTGAAAGVSGAQAGAVWRVRRPRAPQVRERPR